jgi:hypothetical protein
MIGRPAIRRGVRDAALFVGVLALAAAGSHAAARALAPSVPPAVLPTQEHVDDLVRFTGALTGAAADQVRRASGSAEESLVVLLASRDLATCEDLGRQLRELHRAYGAERPFVVLADEKDAGPVRDFIEFERLGRARMAVTDGRIFPDEPSPYTPAAMLVRRSGEVVAGAAHLSRAPNVRLRSFADHLGLISENEVGFAEGGAAGNP